MASILDLFICKVHRPKVKCWHPFQGFLIPIFVLMSAPLPNDNLSSRAPSCFYSGFNAQLTNQNKGKQYLSLWVTWLLSKTQLKMKDTANNSSFYLCGHKERPLCWNSWVALMLYQKDEGKTESSSALERVEAFPPQKENQSFMLMLPADQVPN